MEPDQRPILDIDLSKYANSSVKCVDGNIWLWSAPTAFTWNVLLVCIILTGMDTYCHRFNDILYLLYTFSPRVLLRMCIPLPRRGKQSSPLLLLLPSTFVIHIWNTVHIESNWQKSGEGTEHCPAAYIPGMLYDMGVDNTVYHTVVGNCGVYWFRNIYIYICYLVCIILWTFIINSVVLLLIVIVSERTDK